jgi:hypothetical protein
MSGSKEKQQIIRMDKSACFGTCPIYTMLVFDNGMVEYRGDKFCEKLGIYEKQLSDEEFSIVTSLLKEIDFESLEERYDANLMDAQITTFNFSYNNVSKKVRGIYSWPKSLKELDKALSSIGETEDWKTIRKHDENIYYNEIIFKFKEVPDIEEWVEKYRKFGAGTPSQISKNLDLYLMMFDSKKIDSYEFLEIIQSDKLVENAEFNTKLKMRNR